MTRNLAINSQSECDINHKNDPNDPNHTMIGGAGATIWGPLSSLKSRRILRIRFTFNGTHPAGYVTNNASNVYFTYKTTSSKANAADIGPLAVDLNGHNNVALFIVSNY